MWEKDQVVRSNLCSMLTIMSIVLGIVYTILQGRFYYHHLATTNSLMYPVYVIFPTQITPDDLQT